MSKWGLQVADFTLKGSISWQTGVGRGGIEISRLEPEIPSAIVTAALEE